MNYTEKIKGIKKFAITTWEQFTLFQTEVMKADYISIDTETSGLNTFDLIMAGASFYMGGDSAYYIPVGHTTGEEQLPLETVIGYLNSHLKDKKLIFHNFVFDGLVLKKNGLDLTEAKIFDTMVAAHLLDNRQPKGLKKLSIIYLGYEMETFDDIAKVFNYDSTKVPVERITNYACDDAIVTYFLFMIFKDILKRDGLDQLFYKGEMPWLRCLIHSKRVGVCFDKNLLMSYIPQLNVEIEEVEEQIYAYNESSQRTLFGGMVTKFDITSPKQLATFLFRTLKLPIIDRNEKTGAAGTGVKVLEKLKDKHPVIELIIKHRKLSKLKSSYTDSLLDKVDTDGRLRSDFIDHGTESGRLSSKNPNFQQLPNIDKLVGWQKEMALKYNIRKCFKASPGYKMIAIDYKQQELRVAAFMGNDPVMKDVYLNNRDVHLTTADGCFNLGLTEKERTDGTLEHKKAKGKHYAERNSGKTLNFSILYGAGAWNVSQALKINENEAQKIVDGFKGTYKGIHAYQESVRDDAINKGYCTTYFGRRRYFDAPTSPKEIGKIRREAGNHVIQSFGADVLRFVTSKVYDRFKGTDLRILMYVHDEVVFECKEENVEAYSAILKDIMENTVQIEPPLYCDVGTGKNYHEAK